MERKTSLAVYLLVILLTGTFCGCGTERADKVWVSEHENMKTEDTELVTDTTSTKDTELEIIYDNECGEYEGILGSQEIAMLICRDRDSLKAYYVYRGETTEYTLDGTYDAVTKKFELKDENESLVLTGGTYERADSDGLVVLRGKAKSAQRTEEFELVPNIGYPGSGNKKERIYELSGCSTSEVDAFTDQIMEYFRNDDLEGLATAVSYPVFINNADGQMKIENEKELVRFFRKEMPDDYSREVQNNYRRYLFNNSHGFMFGKKNGFWFGKDSTTGQFKISTFFEVN